MSMQRPARLRSALGAAVFALGANAAGATELSDPRELTPLGERLIFAAYHPAVSQALFGVAAAGGAPEQLGQLHAGFRGAFPNGLVRLGDTVYLTLNDGRTGTELWATDGTAATTRQVADILPGAAGSNPAGLIAFDGQLYFSASTGTGPRLFSSRGTAGSTAPVASASALSNPRQFTVVGTRLFFTATDPAHGDELWAIDRSGAAPRLVRDIRRGPEDAGIGQLTVAGAALYFVASDGVHGAEVWRTDGTTAEIGRAHV